MSNEGKKIVGSQNESTCLEKRSKKVRDQQTGEEFDLIEEQFPDKLAAWGSIVYSLVMAFFFLWQIFDFWVKNYTLIKWLGYDLVGLDTSYDFHVVVYTFLGGAFGGIVNEIRSFIFWHCHKNGFGRRYIWKSLAAPWLGSLLALFVFALISSGVAVLGGNFSEPAADGENISQIIAMFGIGVIAGFGSPKVFLWLDHHVNRIFKFSTESESNLVETTDQKEKMIEDTDNILPVKDVKNKS